MNSAKKIINTEIAGLPHSIQGEPGLYKKGGSKTNHPRDKA